MFVRIKTTPNSPRRSVQLVEGVRDGGKVRQRIVRHIGVAMDEDELERLRQLGEYVKAKLEDEQGKFVQAAGRRLSSGHGLCGSALLRGLRRGLAEHPVRSDGSGITVWAVRAVPSRFGGAPT